MANVRISNIRGVGAGLNKRGDYLQNTGLCAGHGYIGKGEAF